MKTLTPYLVIAFAHSQDRRGRHRDIAWDAWNPDHTDEFGRLPDSGTFLWRGLAAAKHAAARAMLDPAVDQTQIRTNQDRLLAVFQRGYRASYWLDPS